MQRSWFLGDVLSQLFQRPGGGPSRTEGQSMVALAEALVSEEGEVSGYRLAASLLALYARSDEGERRAFFRYLNDDLDIDGAQVAALAQTYADAPSVAGFMALCQAAEPRRQELLRRLNQPAGATAMLVAMRVDLLRFVRDEPDLQRTDVDFVHLLRSWFNQGFLVLKPITWDTPARILDKIVAYEAVHEISDLDDLRQRLDPTDRRCFAYFHPSMPDEPLIFVELALTAQVPGSVDALLTDQRHPLAAEEAKVAVFYSISNCQKGLKGISFGNLLIKQVVAELSRDLPNMQTFVTLSPIPGLMAWLRDTHPEVAAGLPPAEDMRHLAAQYLLLAKRHDGLPQDPVARFHLGNGAEILALHAGADHSANGMAQSGGVMVNYLYDLTKTETNHEDFALRAQIAASRDVRMMAGA